LVDSSLVSTQVTVNALNRALEGYRVLRQVGHGAMGIVYEAEQCSLGRRVALKVLPPNLALRERTVKRFLREAESMGKLAHPNVVDVYEVGSRSDFHYFTMKFVEGPSLDRVLKAGPLAVKDVVGIGIDVATALSHAHARGVLHRDVKPGNLLRDGEKILLTDFGLARQIDGEEGGSVTESGDLVGTPLYMAPEQISGEIGRVDGRADIWGLGVTMYELLAEKPPFSGTNASGILHAILHREPSGLRKMREDVPRDLEAVVHKCLEKDPARRYATAAALLDDLVALRDGKPVTARAPRFFDPLARWMRRHPLEAGIVAASLLVTIVLGFFAQSVWRLLADKSRELIVAQSDTKKAESERDDQARERSVQERERTAASARRAIADARMAWAEGANDEERRQAEERVFDLMRAPALESLPEIRAEVVEFAAELAARHGRTPEAVLAELEPQFVNLDSDAALMLRAAVLTGLGQLDAALQIHGERVRRRPQDPKPWIDAAKLERRVGVAAYEGGQYVAASERLRRAISLLGNALERSTSRELAITSLVERARCRLALAQPQYARLDLDRALGQDPNHLDAQTTMRAAERMIADPKPWIAPDAAPVNVAPPADSAAPPTSPANPAQNSLEAIYGVFEGLMRKPEAGASGAQKPKDRQ